MKFYSKSLACLALPLAALVLSPVSAKAQAGTGFSGVGVTNATGPAVTTNLQYYVIPPRQSAAVVTFVEAGFSGSDSSNATTKVQFYNPTAEQTPTAAAAASGTTITGSTNGLAASDVLLLWSQATDLYQRLTVASLSGSVITVNETIVRAVTIKDKVFKLTLSGRLAGGNSIYTVTGSWKDKIQASSQGGVFVGISGKPALVEAFGTNSPTLNTVSGRYGFWQP